MITKDKISRDMKNKLNYFTFFLLILILVFLFPFVNAVSIAVSPSNLNFNIEIGKTGEENIFIINYDEQEANYEIYAENYKDWFSFSSTSISVAGGQNKMVKVNVTPNQTGEFETLIYVKAALQKNGSGVGFAPGIEIKTKINITEPLIIPEETPIVAPVPSSGGGGGSSSSGGSGGSYAQIQNNTNKNNTNISTSLSSMNLTNTSETAQKTQDKQEENVLIDGEVDSAGELETAGITGAVVGSSGKKIGGLIIIAVILAAGILAVIYNKNRIKKQRLRGFK